MTIHVTDTQRFIVRAALEVSGALERFRDPALIDDIIRAMLVIEGGRMQPYVLRGFNWSCMSRSRREPVAVGRDKERLDRWVEWFHQHIDRAREEPARRIRGNRARRFRQLVREAQRLQDIFHPDAANWDGEPRPLPLANAD